jgi:lipopolysaccharide export system protein LptA
MPLSVSRLRRWFAVAAVFVCLVVAGTYFYAKHRVQNALKHVPEKIGLNIQQSAQGFTISKSEQGRTLFKLQASKAVQFKQGGQIELHNVAITLYGRDSSRFDQVYGEDFEYDQQSGDVTSKGEVSIDLQANPQGILDPDQAPPKELKNPLHLKTTGLVFNQKTGDARTPNEIDFSVPQASGSAVGAEYIASEGTLTLKSQVKIIASGPMPSTILAEQAVVEKKERQILLSSPRAENPEQQAQADDVTLFLRQDNTLDRAVATGKVRLNTLESLVAQPASSQHATSKSRQAGTLVPTWSKVSAQKLEVWMKPHTGIDHAVLSGDVQLSREGLQSADAIAGRAMLAFSGKNVLTRVHAEQQVKLLQHQKGTSSPQDVEVTAPAMDFLVAEGRRLSQADTVGPPEIAILPPSAQPGMQTHATADKFTAKFDSLGQLASVHGQANARVVTISPDKTGDHNRVTTSDSIDAFFQPGAGVSALTQQGHFVYTDGSQQAFADHARYTVADQILVLTGSPRIVDTGMATTARTIRLNRATGDGQAQGDVKSTYSDLKPQPGGALLASSDPVHVTANTMVAHKSPSVATYTGNARLWQNANVVEAPSIQFQKNDRALVADSAATQKVSTVLVGADKNGKPTVVTVTANHLTYRDSERKAHFEGAVMATSSDMTITSNQMDVFLTPANLGRRASSPVPAQSAGNPPAASKPPTAVPASLEKIIASGNVIITEPNRRGSGETLTYTTADDKFILTGGPPSIFDAERGKITGVSLTLYRRDDRVVVEGDSSSPAVTQTRVVR